ncbi:MAG: DUF2306 domain-containing protein [Terricaulis silvestris]
MSAVDDLSPGKTWIGVAGWAFAAFLAIGVGLYGMSYLPTMGAHAPPGVRENGAGLNALIAHATGAGLALLIGPFQFIDTIRRRAPTVHHWIGRTYVLACIVGGLAGAWLAPNTTAGPFAAVGFFLLAVAWLTTTTLAWRAAAVKHDYQAHKRWMVRSFALTFAAVTLRLYLPLSFMAGIDFTIGYPAIAWLCWVPNLIAAEVWLASRKLTPAVAT